MLLQIVLDTIFKICYRNIHHTLLKSMAFTHPYQRDENRKKSYYTLNHKLMGQSDFPFNHFNWTNSTTLDFHQHTVIFLQTISFKCFRNVCLEKIHTNSSSLLFLLHFFHFPWGKWWNGNIWVSGWRKIIYPSAACLSAKFC